MKKRIKVAPSVIAADQACLGQEVKRVEAAGADLLHIDVMDGNFVPNITIGPGVIKDLRKVSKLPMEAHLMIAHPEKYVAAFAQAGANFITIHIEACASKTLRVIRQIQSLNAKAGICLNPATPLSAIKRYLKQADMVLVMTVNPGFCGQRFMPSVLPKIKALRKAFKGQIAVDGGINQETARSVVSCGADILASGSYIFKARDPRQAILRLKQCQDK